MKKTFLQFLILPFVSISINADNFEYQKNLISCQHNFLSCDLSLLKDADKNDIDLVKIQLNQEIALAEAQKASLTKLNASTPLLIKSNSYLPYTSSQNSYGKCAENGSCYGDISSLTGRPKTVAVKGYYRKDGTYVRGHYRSKPKKK